MMLVSVLMPVYKPDPGFLEEAIKSILEQDYKDLELVAVEDPSPANGRKVFESFNDPRIRYHLNEKRTSLREQLNLGLSLCRGTYIARMDADDISYPSRIGKQLRYLLEHPEINLVGTNLDYMSSSGKPMGLRRYPERHEDIARDLRLYASVAHATIMVKRVDILAMEGYRDAAPMEDWDLWCRMLMAGMKFHNIQETLYSYRQHAGMGKYKGLRKTLRTGIELKKKYFKDGRGTWGFRENLRCWVENVLMYVPAPVVFGLFLVYATFIENRRSNSKAKVNK
jgi:glycosyltransferase involved in cell wall biosynthesis